MPAGGQWGNVGARRTAAGPLALAVALVAALGAGVGAGAALSRRPNAGAVAVPAGEDQGPGAPWDLTSAAAHTEMAALRRRPGPASVHEAAAQAGPVVVTSADGALSQASCEALAEALGAFLAEQGMAGRMAAVAVDSGAGSRGAEVTLSSDALADRVVARRVDGTWALRWQAEVDREAAAAERAAADQADGGHMDAATPEREAAAPQGVPSAQATEDVDTGAQEAYVAVTSAAELAQWLDPACAEALAGGLATWASGVAGLRNAEYAYLVASTVTEGPPAAFTLVIPQGMLDGDLAWVDVQVRCTYDGGALTFSL